MKSKKVLIVGGNSGVGLALAQRLEKKEEKSLLHRDQHLKISYKA
jgi:NAD(P)-dependent dehydrogenase (short-subunit alcohol dehydrogenase family)